MMTVQMDKMSAAPSWERAQSLYEKNIELENKRRRSAQARVPSDPNAWQQMRENYEAIILEDHAFSEQHNIEHALWHLHYRRIEELRAHFSTAISSMGSSASQGVKVAGRPDRVTKIRLQFKTFLSEATGFYHDLILKIRAKYGLPLGYFSEDSENRIVMDKDGKKSTEVKKGLVSCHRCLIYLGDLARYKGLYGEGDSKSCEYAAASSYYLQAASLWPSSGNPHHQLAILASYLGDELVAIYRYFRSLAVDSPFTTARDNLIVAFEKNRQNYSQMSGDVKSRTTKEPLRSTGKGRGKGEEKLASKDTDTEASSVKESSCIQEKLKSFCIRFVRLNGILFTRTSLETFAEVLALVSSGLCELLSSGAEMELSFGSDATKNALFIIRVISTLIFTVHNLRRESENQTYAEIVQRAALLQNAFTAVFELMGYIMGRCIQLNDPSSSYLLPGILVFVEWLACCPDIAAGKDVNERQATTVRSNFWNLCVSFLNKILSVGSLSADDDEDVTCFFNMSRYDEGETENRLALWEDFELRGFLPLLPAQTILDFSRKHCFGGDGNKERKARIKRILAAGKALANVLMVDQKTVCFDSRANKFIIGVEISDEVTFTSYSDISQTNDVMHENQCQKMNMGVTQTIRQLYVDGEEEDEVIVFKPVVTEKRADVIGSNLMSLDGLKPGHGVFAGDLQFYGGSVSAPIDNICQPSTFHASSQIHASVGNILPHQLQPMQFHASKLLIEDETALSSSLKGLRVLENGHFMKHEMQENLGISLPAARPVPIQQTVNPSTSSMFYSHGMGLEAMVPSKTHAIASSGVIVDSLAVKASSALPAGLRKTPVSRPVRHLGPPPGFSPVPPKQVTASIFGSDLAGECPLMDDYSWLDGYRLPSAKKGSGHGSSVNYPYHTNPQYISNSNGLAGTVSFPFPGKQVPAIQFQVEKQKGWQDYQALEELKLQHEQQLQPQQQQLMNGNLQFTPLPEEYQGQSIWAGRYLV